MAKSQKSKKAISPRRTRSKPSKKNSPPRSYVVLAAFIEVIGKIIDRFGWPGALMILGYIFIERYATSEQKREIIDKFVLGKELPAIYPVMILVVLFVLIISAQQLLYSKRVSVLEAEIQRLADWKSDYQEKNIDQQLHHST